MRQLIAIGSVLLTLASIYKFRYKLMNLFLRQPMLRQFAIMTVLRFPFIRQRIMGSLFTFPSQPPTKSSV
ncbi:hypothetical protein JOC54_001375 [Alkalihalobacillus xiaoxiensis]|uniref:Uncharacterized protein n=1 Tax=Shouchella xiaoxiensis TaxID=766895 RepID=A0ABS2SRJ8_9BACI|nr:hypothetical protein [Shouchella xiaoxiensis]MBM7838144.1 hypothetical protein [Shouchella xiaoxiensis]